MKKLSNLLVAILLTTMAITSCKKDKSVVVPPPAAPEVLSGDINANKTLTADRAWILTGETHVTTGVTLTIEPGTIIKSDVAQKGALVIDKGGKLVANGTIDRPIVFTSGKAAGERAPGDWAGITIIGNAPTNRVATAIVEGGVRGSFGLGTLPNDNSGSLKYVRIEYAGIAFSANSEVNALSLYAVGNGTTLEHIMVSFAKDDAFEFFGGTVNGKYLIAYGTSDDDFDFDFGYSGRLQFGVSMKRPELVDGGDQSNGIECDNESPVPATGPSMPRTKPVISNFTFIGTNGAAGELAAHNFALRFRRASEFVFNNSVLIGYKEGGFVMESAATATSYNTNASSFKNNLVHALKLPYGTFDSGAQGILLAAAVKTKAESEGCLSLANGSDAGLTAPYNLTAPIFTPAAGSPALLGTWIAPESATTFFTAVTYRGAFGATGNWLAGWANFTPNATAY